MELETNIDLHAHQLGDGTLPDLAGRIDRPTYERSNLKARIAHIGVGGFHRSHLALYCHLLANEGGDWGIHGLGLKDADQDMRDALQQQSYLYTLVARDSDRTDVTVIGSLLDMTVAGESSTEEETRDVQSVIADPITKILSLTVTEAGYAVENNRTFDVIGGALQHRMQDCGAPLTIMSCDNLPGNGDAAKAATLHAVRSNPELIEWISNNVTFPNGMVDRITPVTTDEDRRMLAESFGIKDARPVVCEQFVQWVIEDNFAAGRPDFASVGVLYSQDVHAWERYKLRFLNAGHSVIAYLAALSGFEFVDEALANETMASYLSRFLLKEAHDTVDEIAGHPRDSYIESVIKRFNNTIVRDQIQRLCIDGSAKFPTFLTPTIEANIQNGGHVGLSALALAAWAKYLETTPESERAHDTRADVVMPLVQKLGNNPRELFEYHPIFTETLRKSDLFATAFINSFEALGQNDALQVIDMHLK